MNVFITIFHPSFSPDWFVLILFWLKLNWFDLVKNECLHCIHFPSSDSPEWFRLVYFDFIVSLELPSCLHLWQSRLVWRLRTPSFSPRDDPFTLLWMRTMNDLCLMAHIYGSIRKMGKSWLHFLMSMNLRQRMIYNETFDGTVQIQLLLLLLLHSTSTSTVVYSCKQKIIYDSDQICRFEIHGTKIDKHCLFCSAAPQAAVSGSTKGSSLENHKNCHFYSLLGIPIHQKRRCSLSLF